MRWILATLVALVALPARADEDDDVAARLELATERLEAQAKTATAWHVGWAGVYGLGLAVQAGRAALSTDPAEQADLGVSAGKAAVGVVARLVRPPKTMMAARQLRLMPARTPEERARKLARAEQLLVETSREADQRWHWLPHTLNVGLNVAGMLVVGLGWGDWGRAATSAGIGVAVGELNIMSQPWRAKGDLRDYRRRFAIRPAGLGAAVAVTF